MLHISILWVLAYLGLYGILCGIWNCIIIAVSNAKILKIKKENPENWLEITMAYQEAGTKCIFVKMANYMPLAPLATVICIILWPVYLLMLIAFGIYYYRHYLCKT